MEQEANKPSPIGREIRDSQEENLPGMQLVGLEPTISVTFHTIRCSHVVTFYGIALVQLCVYLEAVCWLFSSL